MHPSRGHRDDDPVYRSFEAGPRQPRKGDESYAKRSKLPFAFDASGDCRKVKMHDRRGSNFPYKVCNTGLVSSATAHRQRTAPSRVMEEEDDADGEELNDGSQLRGIITHESDKLRRQAASSVETLRVSRPWEYKDSKFTVRHHDLDFHSRPIRCSSTEENCAEDMTSGAKLFREPKRESPAMIGGALPSGSLPTADQPSHCEISKNNFKSRNHSITKISWPGYDIRNSGYVAWRSELLEGSSARSISDKMGKGTTAFTPPALTGRRAPPLQDRKCTIKVLNGNGSSQRRFQCSFCKKVFRQRYNVVVHIRTHTGEKPHKCNICGRGFAQNSNLKRHLRSHMKRQPSLNSVNMIRMNTSELEGIAFYGARLPSYHPETLHMP
mmetsp:Transcript_5472/g.7619  ORF Transcript_5472/g.7619 Transcript_5472/m.7619 type:complete len:382 (-) Transcript_5472:129-1274(-)